jgi:nucleoside-diphosphate-sugar epimerase
MEIINNFSDSSKSNKVLITGGTGFIGSRLISSFLSQGIEPILLSRKKHSFLKTIICDFENFNLSESDLIDVNLIFHLGGIAHDTTSKQDILEKLFNKINYDASTKLAELAGKCGVNKFVFVSTVKAGGSSSVKCVDENDNLSPLGMYAKSKKLAEDKISLISEKYNMNFTIARPALVYGPNLKGNLLKMKNGIINNWFPPIPETRNKRSLVHIDDLIRALLFIANETSTNGKTFNICEVEPYSTRQIFNQLCRSVGKQAPSWSIPKWFFKLIKLINTRAAHNIDKIFGNECYSSKLIVSLGFKFKNTLENIDYSEYD